MLKRKNIIKIAIDSPAAAGAGTQAKLISKHYNLLQLDTGRIYRYVAYIKTIEPKKFNYNYLRKKINKLKISSLCNKKLLSDEVATIASVIAKDKMIRKLLNVFILPKVGANIDAKSWIQKILLEERYRKINS